ncbi:dipicolinate synthase subunit B [Candidatus Epulonipiscium fishelsonii]|uniref:Dipicolinate synthase subunit B n=1 Tax=Candidatus Epulonipiscium fishelsonii TaxID=77094 RepID=A0ACC8X9V3_9FIRM|nr:dipicolinate synthase subunit B [Epulopiscium sp. SCG-B11WGA-EpuloA1]ONI43181.1 dipicolinate synthase subunit B [Epulopiscium sp. SCG-B05WGA-EpuloA1]
MKELHGLKLGVALCGSFCTFSKAIIMIENLVNMGVEVYPIMSFNAYEITTRFGKREDFIKQVEDLSGKEIIHTIVGAEPIGPKHIVDAMLVAPCTGNTLTKIANSITDTPVTLATKSVLRNNTPVIIAISTNDGLGMNLKNIGQLIYNQNIFFVPFGQDNPINKPCSLISNLDLVPETIKYALEYKQVQPILL